MKRAKLLLVILSSFIGIDSQVFGQIIGDTIVCTSQSYTYETSAITGATYFWEVTGARATTSLTSNSIDILWGNVGNGTLLVKKVLPTGQTLVDAVNISIIATPQILFPTTQLRCTSDSLDFFNYGYAFPKVCENITETYALHDNGNDFIWEIEGGVNLAPPNSSTAQILWDSTTFGTIKVKETNVLGCADSMIFTVEKATRPQANFMPPSSVCKNSPITFNNTSLNATEFIWFFGDGQWSSDYQPQHQYAQAGTYTVKLIAKSGCNCLDTIQKVINVSSYSGPSISCISTLCAGDTATYTTLAVEGCDNQWYIEGGQIIDGQGTESISVVWGQGPAGTIGLSQSNCPNTCSDTTFSHIPLIAPLVDIIGPDVICAQEIHNYLLPNFMGTVYSWHVQSLCNPVYSYTYEACNKAIPFYAFEVEDTCSYLITVEYYNNTIGCGGTASKIIKVRPKLVIEGINTACTHINSYFVANSNAAWSISPAGPLLIPNQNGITVDWNGLSGTFILGVVDTTNLLCSDSAFLPIEVAPKTLQPIISGDTVLCASSTVSYCVQNPLNTRLFITGGTLKGSNGTCHTIEWGLNPPYLIKAVNYGDGFCPSDTTTLNISIFQPSSGNQIAGPTAICPNTTITYSLTAPTPSNANISWSISPSFAGTVVSQSGQTVEVQWGSNNATNVTLSANIEACGNSSPQSISVNLLPSPQPAIQQLNTLCSGGNATLQSGGGQFTQLVWDGPNGYTSNLATTTISSAGVYTLTVEDANGCVASSVHEVVKATSPDAHISTFDFTTHCIGSNYSVEICALVNDDYQYLWSNGTIAPCISASSVGDNWVIITDTQNGCSSISDTITIEEITCTGGGGFPIGSSCVPVGSIGFNHSQCNPITFSNTSVNASSYTWDFDDNTLSNAASPTHTYNQAGYYLVKLIATFPNSSGVGNCIVIDTGHVNISVAAAFDYVPSCFGKPLCFIDKSTFTIGNDITQWQWDFGDGNQANTRNACHTYSQAGIYTVTLSTTNRWCTVTHTDTIVVEPLPSANFSYTAPACAATPIYFLPVANTTASGWSWDFGDTGLSENTDPSHTYPIAGNYTVSLAVSDARGCSDTSFQSITINPASAPQLISAYPDTIACAGETVALIAPSCGNCTYQWSNGSTNDTILVNTTGIYQLTVTEPNRCPYTTYIRVHVAQKPDVLLNPSFHCARVNLYVRSNYYPPHYSYDWISNDIGINASTSGYISATLDTGNYYFQLIVTDMLSGCTDTSVRLTHTVKDLQPPTFTVLDSIKLCKDEYFRVTADHPDPSVTLLWNYQYWQDTLFTNRDYMPYTLTATDTHGCSKTVSTIIEFPVIPKMCNFHEGCLDVCYGYQLEAPAGADNYQWMLNGLPFTGQNSNVLVPTIDGAYSVILATTSGCVDTTGTVFINLSECPNGIAESKNSRDNLWQIYPNPTTGKFTIAFQPETYSHYSISIYNTIGGLVWATEDVSFENGPTDIELGDNLPSGIYIILLINEHGSTAKRLIVNQ